MIYGVNVVHFIKASSKVFLTMAMAAIGLSTNLRDLKNMGLQTFCSWLYWNGYCWNC
jgi:uncharacterized membrane protein YadS